MMADHEEIFGAVERKHIYSLISENKRLDGRDRMSVRPIDVDIGSIKKAD